MSTTDGFDQALTVFNPEGKLFQVEYAFRAVKTSGLSHVAVRCLDGVVLVSQLQSADRLVDTANNTFIHEINELSACMICGRIADGRRVIDRVRSEAVDFFRTWNYQPTADILCTRLADINQVYTQEAWQRPFGNIAVFAGWDPEQDRSLLFKTDPAGTNTGHFAIAAGIKEVELTDALTAHIKGFPDGVCESTQKGLDCALKIFQNVISTGLTGDDVEVAIYTKTGLRRMTPIEVDKRLGELAVQTE